MRLRHFSTIQFIQSYFQSNCILTNQHQQKQQEQEKIQNILKREDKQIKREDKQIKKRRQMDQKVVVEDENDNDLKMVDKDVLNYILERKNKKQEFDEKKEVIPSIPQKKWIEYVLRAQKENKKLLVIHTQGSYNPPHIGHINMILYARDVIEASGKYILLAAYMSTSPDQHINQKTKQSESSSEEEYLHLSFNERCHLVEIMIKNQGLQDWIFVNRYEGMYEKVAVTKTWINMQETMFEAMEENKEAFKAAGVQLANLNKIIEVAFLVGSDKLNYTGRTMDNYSKDVKVNHSSYHLPIIIKQRADQNNDRAKEKMEIYMKYTKEQSIANKIFVCCDRENFSSTKFREYINKHSRK